MKPRRWRDIFRMRARSLFKRRQVEQELDKELRFHLDQQIEEMLAIGLSPEDARSEALKRIGGFNGFTSSECGWRSARSRGTSCSLSSRTG